MENKGNEGFSSFFGFLMVMIGFAVGIGSLWRFPYVCGTNGGALFILVYTIIILLVGIPLLTAEMTIGYKSQKTAISAYEDLEPKGSKWHFAGFVHAAAGLMILSYTVPIYAWVLTYIYRTATGFFVGMDAAGISTAFDALNGDYKTLFIAAIINWALTALVVSRGLQGGVEKLSKVILPALAVIMVVCIIIGLRIPGATKGLSFLFTPKVENFTFSSLATAISQSFYALGLAMLGGIVFGGCIKDKKANISKNATIISVAIIFAGIAAGLMIFPIVFAFNLEPAAGVSLSLITLPNAFNAVKGGRILGTVFYIGFYIAAFSSSMGVCEAVVCTLMDSLKWTRKKALIVTLTIAVVVGSASLMNTAVFDKLDILTSNYLLVIGGFLISIFTGWIWGADNFLDAANVKNGFVRMWLKVCIKFVCPIAIAITFLGNFINF